MSLLAAIAQAPLAPDGVHPTPEGYAGRTVLTAQAVQFCA